MPPPPLAAASTLSGTSDYLISLNDGYVPGDGSVGQDPSTNEPGASSGSLSPSDPFSPDTRNPEVGSAQRLCSDYGATYEEDYTGFGLFRAAMTDAQAQTMTGDSRVDFVELNATMDVLTTQTLPDPEQWGLDAIDGVLDGSYTYSNTGSAVNVYVVDSGILAGHTDFAGLTVKLDYNAFNNTSPGVENSAPMSDDLGHGTEISSLIGGSKCGVAKQVILREIKVAKSGFLLDEGTVVRGLK